MLSVVSRLRSESDRKPFLALSAELATWLKGQPGFVRYELIDGGLAMADRIEWVSRAEAEQGNREFAGTPIAAGFAEVVSESVATLGVLVP